MKLTYLSALAALSLISAPAVAQSPTIILQRGQPIPGLQGINMTGLIKFAINDAGEWMAQTNTNSSDEDTDEVILRNGFLTLQEGTIVGTPSGANIDAFGSLNINEAGDSYWEFSLAGASVSGGVYRNTRAIALSGDLLNCPSYSRNATWLNFRGVVKGNNNNQILVGCEVNDSAIGGTADQAILLINLDDNGNILQTVDIAHESGQVPQIGNTIGQNSIPFNQVNQMDLNDLGDVLWQAKITGGDAIFLNDQVLMREGQASPVPGFNWGGLNNARVALSDVGDWLVLGSLSGGPQNRRDLLVVNNEKVLRERDTIPAIAPLLIDNFAIGTPLFVTNSGEAIFRAQWTGAGATDTGLLLTHDIIVREGITNLGGVTIGEFPDGESAIATSPGGRYVVFECTLDDDTNVVGLVDIGRVSVLPACQANSGRLRRASGFPLAGQTLALGMDDAQATASTPFLLVSDCPIFTYPPCGVNTAFGELIIDFGDNGNPFLLLIGNPWLGAEVPINIAIANNTNLIDKKVYAQGIFFDIAGGSGGETLRLTNAVEIEIGAP